MDKYDLEKLILQGEGYRIEYKGNIDKSFIEEIVAFSNASGGKLLLGISDDGIIKGVDTSNVARSRIQTSMKQISPNIDAEIEVIENIIAIHVKEGTDKPYACSKGFYLRMGANSQKLERDDIIEFFQSEGKMRFDELLQAKINFRDIFDDKSYSRFLKLANISNVIDEKDVLVNLDCGVIEDEFIINNAGVLFFAKEPEKIIKHSYVVCALYKGLEKVNVLDRKDIKGNLISVIEDSLMFLKKHLNLRYEITGSRRKEILDIPEVALREAVINAVCHRDYFEKGAQVMVEIFDDRVVISNPGGLPKGLDKKNFGKLSMARNPVIASLLQRTDYIEKMGTGINRIYNAMDKAGLPKPNFDINCFFVATFKRESYLNDVGVNVGADVGVNVGVKIKLSDVQRGILNKIRDANDITAESIAEGLNVSKRTVERNLKILREKNIIKRIGSDKTGYWQILKEK